MSGPVFRAWRGLAAAVWICGAILSAVVAGADPLPQPAGKPVLTISGKIAVTNKDTSAVFDRAALESLGTVAFTTATPWYKEPVTFEGVPLAKLMAAVGASGEKIVAFALNDYSAEVPMEDVRKYNVILALKRDGEYMPVRDKGPLFIVYPFDSDPELKNRVYYGRSVWQVARLEIK
jgi:hypothetical protein